MGLRCKWECICVMLFCEALRRFIYFVVVITMLSAHCVCWRERDGGEETSKLGMGWGFRTRASASVRLFFVPYGAWHLVVVEMKRCCAEAGYRDTR